MNNADTMKNIENALDALETIADMEHRYFPIADADGYECPAEGCRGMLVCDGALSKRVACNSCAFASIGDDFHAATLCAACIARDALRRVEDVR